MMLVPRKLPFDFYCVKHFRNLEYNRCLPLERNSQAFLQGSLTALWYNQRKCRGQTYTPTTSISTTSRVSCHQQQMCPWHPHSLHPSRLVSPSCLPRPTHTLPFWLPIPTSSLDSKFRHSFLALTLDTLSGIGPSLHTLRARHQALGLPAQATGPTPDRSTHPNRVETLGV